MISYLILFTASFAAATFLPFYSEVVLLALIREGEPLWILVLVASVGNSLGSVVNWALGRYLLHFKDRRWFYFKDKQIDKMQNWFQHYGIWSLLFAWLPLGGDALTFVAGVMKVRLLVFLPLVMIGKSIRYIVLVYFAQWGFSLAAAF